MDLQPLRCLEVCFWLDLSVHWRFFRKLMAVEVSVRVISPGQIYSSRRVLKMEDLTFRGDNLKQEAMKEVWKRCGKKLRRG